MTGQEPYFEKALLCNAWFFGKNDLRLSLYDPETGGCGDGLTETGVNQNQGAESTLAYVLCSLAVESAIARRNRRPTTKDLVPVKGDRFAEQNVRALKKSEAWQTALAANQ